MTSIATTEHRDSVRHALGVVALFVSALSCAAVLLMAIGALTSPVFAGDFENGTHDYDGLEGFGYFILAAPIAALIGALFGRGRPRVGCTVILAVITALPIVASVVITIL